MAIQAQGQHASVSESPALAMNWIMEDGRLRCRWVTAEARPLKPDWLERTQNPGEHTAPAVVRQTRLLYLQVVGKLAWLIHLFCWPNREPGAGTCRHTYASDVKRGAAGGHLRANLANLRHNVTMCVFIAFILNAL